LQEKTQLVRNVTEMFLTTRLIFLCLNNRYRIQYSCTQQQIAACDENLSVIKEQLAVVQTKDDQKYYKKSESQRLPLSGSD